MSGGVADTQGYLEVRVGPQTDAFAVSSNEVSYLLLRDGKYGFILGGFHVPGRSRRAQKPFRGLTARVVPSHLSPV